MKAVIAHFAPQEGTADSNMMHCLIQASYLIEVHLYSCFGYLTSDLIIQSECFRGFMGAVVLLVYKQRGGLISLCEGSS